MSLMWPGECFLPFVPQFHAHFFPFLPSPPKRTRPLSVFFFFFSSGRLSFVKLFRSRQALSLSRSCGLPPSPLFFFIFFFCISGFGKDRAFRMALKKKKKKRNMQSKTTKPVPEDLCRSHTKPIFIPRLNKLQQQKGRKGRKWKKGSGYDSSLINQERMPHRHPMRKTNPKKKKKKREPVSIFKSWKNVCAMTHRIGSSMVIS